MAALYEIEARYADLLAALDCAETEEEAEAIWSQLDAMEGDVKDRAEAYARIVRSKQAEAESYKAEAQRLAKETVDAAVAALDGFGPEADFLRQLVRYMLERKN